MPRQKFRVSTLQHVWEVFASHPQTKHPSFRAWAERMQTCFHMCVSGCTARTCLHAQQVLDIAWRAACAQTHVFLDTGVHVCLHLWS